MAEPRQKTFGQVVAEARAARNMQQKDVAAQILKENGEPISVAYLSEIENDRRNPPSDHIIEQLSSVLKIPRVYLYAKARRFPPEINPNSAQQTLAAFQALSAELQESIAA